MCMCIYWIYNDLSTLCDGCYIISTAVLLFLFASSFPPPIVSLSCPALKQHLWASDSKPDKCEEITVTWWLNVEGSDVKQWQLSQWRMFEKIFHSRIMMLSRDGTWLLTCFRLMIGFIWLFDTGRHYTLQFTITHTHASVTSSLAVAWYRLLMADVPLASNFCARTAQKTPFLYAVQLLRSCLRGCLRDRYSAIA
jgi:hypothetical protein